MSSEGLERRCGRRRRRLGAKVEKPVGGDDHVEIVFDDLDGLTLIDEALFSLRPREPMFAIR